MRTHAEDNATLWNLLIRRKVHVVRAEIEGGHSLMFLELGPNLIGHGVRPRVLRQVQVLTEDPRELFRFDQLLVHVPNKTISYSVCLCLKFNADGHKRCDARCLPVQRVLRS